MNVTVKRRIPIKKGNCLYCGEERVLYDVTIKQIYDNSIRIGMCKLCLCKLAYQLNEQVVDCIKEKKND